LKKTKADLICINNNFINNYYKLPFSFKKIILSTNSSAKRDRLR